MNKDVIYIEPEDDITDIIAKIEKAKEKIVALVPPKKAGVFRSLVNIKLIAKASAGAEKTVVLVTMDPSIMKLAAATRIPVAKNLQTAPVILEENALMEDESTHTIESVDEDGGEVKEDGEGAEKEAADADKNEHAGASKSSDEKHRKTEVEDEDSDSDEEGKKEGEEAEDAAEDEADRKAKKAKGPSKGIVGWIKNHKKLTIAGGICLVAIIGFLVWAFGFAPAVDITVAIKTDSKNFSENITFVDSAANESAKEGKFYLEQKKTESESEVKFEATGKKNNGEKASGEVTVVGTISASGGSKVINTGDVFKINGLSYTATKSVTMSYVGYTADEDLSEAEKVCSNYESITTIKEFKEQGCRIYATVPVTATEAGTSYNIDAASSGWSTTADVEVYSSAKIAGGTDDIKTVVQQSDIEKAKTALTTSTEDEVKEALYKTIDEDEYLIIEGSFAQNTESAVATPGVNEEVKDGVQPTLKAKTTATVYVISRDKLKEFIEAKANLEDGQKIYDIDNLRVENFSATNGVGNAKLKAQYYIGPKITETEVVEKVMGKGLGDAQRELRDLYGVSDVTMNKSYPWVTSVPTDSNKVTVKFEIKDQNGNEVQGQSTSTDSTSSTATEESKD